MAQMIAECKSFSDMYNMLWAKVDRWPENRFLQKKHLKQPVLLGFLTLGGRGGQNIDTRSASSLPLEIWGYNGSN